MGFCKGKLVKIARFMGFVRENVGKFGGNTWENAGYMGFVRENVGKHDWKHLGKMLGLWDFVRENW